MAIVVGTNGNDDLDGTANNDLIIAGNGDDTIDGGDGHDLIFAGRGDDTIDGGAGNDVIVAGSGDDTVDGGDGHDVIFGGRGDDTIVGGDGNDLIFGGSGNDTIDGGEGCDIISAGRGDDLVIFDVDENAGAQNYFSGGSGNDTLRLRLTQSQFNEMTAAGVFAAFASHVGSHSGFDFASFGLSFPLNLKVWYFEQIDIEITGSPGLFTNGDDSVDFNTVVAGTYQDGTQYDGLDGNDTVTLANTAAAAAAAGFVVGTAFNAGAGNDTVNGGALDDIINGDAGNDVLNGGTGVDVLNGGDDDDRLILEDINVGDSVDGGDGNDTFVFAAANGMDHNITASATQVQVDGTFISVTNVENYEFTGADGNDFIRGRDGNDIIRGEGGADQIEGDLGVDQLFGGAGNDILIFRDADTGDLANGGTGFDDYRFITNTVTNNTITATTTNVTVDGQVVQLVDIERILIEAGGGDDLITGSALADLLRGQDDNDTINGGDGNDQIEGGTGIDNLNGGGGNDILLLSDADNGDMVDGGADTDAFQYNDGSGANNVITVTPSDVTVDGATIQLTSIERVIIQAGDGNDLITGGIGNDLLRGQNGNDTILSGAGTDQIEGGDGDDRLVLEDISAGDTINGGADTDTLVYAASLGANHTITGTAGDFTVDGVTITVIDLENFEITGGDQDDTITTHDGDDVIDALTGNDTIDAGDGNDEIFIDDGGDTIDGGLGFDALVVRSNDEITANLGTGTLQFNMDPGDTMLGIERLVTGDGADDITGTAGNDTIETAGGGDRVNAVGGLDVINLGDNDDLLLVSDLAGDIADGGDGRDSVNFNFGQSVNFDMGTGVVTLVGGGDAGSYVNFEGASIFGSGGSTLIGTNTSNNTQVSGSNNTVSLLDGDDNVNLLNPGDNNALDGGDGTFDSIRFDTSSNVTVDLSTPIGTYAIGLDTGTLTGFEVIRTRAGDDTVTGSDGNNRIEVSTGMDTVATGLGDDNIFIADGGGDSLDGGGGDNDGLFIVTTDNITIDLSLAANNLQVGADAVSTVINIENITAFGGNDTLIGSSGRDNLNGGAGNDTITTGLVTGVLRDAVAGGDGDDTLIFNGSGVQASGGLGMDTFEFIDYNPGIGTQNALLFDVDVTEMDKIDVSDWNLGLTPGDIAALATQGPTVNDSALSLDGGDLTMTIFGINTADLIADANDIFIV